MLCLSVETFSHLRLNVALFYIKTSKSILFFFLDYIHFVNTLPLHIFPGILMFMFVSLLYYEMVNSLKTKHVFTYFSDSSN